MLVALTAQNEKFVLTKQCDTDTLRKLRQQQTFYCPQCKQPLILKVGTVKIPHFAHTQYTSCEHFFSEGESAQHLKGKQLLFEWLSSKQQDVLLEPYFQQLQQRPDLFVRNEQKQLAIEFQCSPIATERLLARTAGFQKNQMAVWWITPEPKYELEKGFVKVRLNNVQQQCIQTNRWPYIVTLHVEKERFTYFSSLIHLKQNEYVAVRKIVAIASQSFPILQPKPASLSQFQVMFTFYKQTCAKFVQHRFRYSKAGVQDVFLRAAYELNVRYDQLPLFIGVPLRDSEYVPLFTAEWQLALFYFVQKLDLHVSHLKEEDIIYFLQWLQLPISKTIIRVVQRYISVCVQINAISVHAKVERETIERVLYGDFVANAVKT